MTGVNGIPFEKSMGFCNINNDLHAKFFRPAIMIVLAVPLLGVAITVISPNAALRLQNPLQYLFRHVLQL
jgi:hypothetical protein